MSGRDLLTAVLGVAAVVFLWAAITMSMSLP